MEFKMIRFDLREGVAHLSLNRPESANSINQEMAQELMEAALRCDEDPDIRAVLISGEGKIFSGGGDLKAFASADQKLSSIVKETTTYLHAAISRLTRMNAPVVAAVHGAVAGAGLSLLLAADLVVAAESTKFTAAYTRAGLTPDGALTYFLPRIVGLRRALELTLTNRVFSATEAYAWGIVTRVVPDKALLNEAGILATALSEGATPALGAAKRLLHRGWTETLETQMENEAQAIAEAARTPNAREGIRAFLEKRPPKFSGK